MTGDLLQHESGHQFEAVDKADQMVYISAARTLEVFETHVRVTANTANPSFTLTLPPVTKARGRVYSILSDIANAQAVTLASQGDARGFTNFTLDADEDAVLLYSDGEVWWVLSSRIA